MVILLGTSGIFLFVVSYFSNVGVIVIFKSLSTVLNETKYSMTSFPV